MVNSLDSSYLKTSPYKPGIFDGKVVFVTGGAGAICRVQVEALVLLGANAAIIGRNKEKTENAAKEIASLRPGAQVLPFGNIDVRQVDHLVGAVDQTVAKLGKIDFVIAGAAGNFLSSFNGLSSNAFKTVIDIDLVGSYNTAKATFDQLKRNKGHIIFVSATLYFTGLPMQAHASAAKAGVDSLMRTLAVELGPLGVQSNSILPGPIDSTEGLDRLMPEEVRNDSIRRIPSQRLGKSRDIADCTVFLLSNAASYINGTMTVVDGGSWQTGNSMFGTASMYPDVLNDQNTGKAKI